MPRITPESLLTLEAYSKVRGAFRTRVIRHKQGRIVHVGEHVTLLFEDELTIRYQIQEMLRAERIFEEEAILAELDAYSALVPDGTNWKATMLIEYLESAERRAMLSKLVGVENRVWMEVAGCARVYALANDGRQWEDTNRTAAVHFLHFEIEPPVIAALRRGATLSFGIDHPHYRTATLPVAPAVSESLLNDLAT